MRGKLGPERSRAICSAGINTCEKSTAELAVKLAGRERQGPRPMGWPNLLCTQGPTQGLCRLIKPVNAQAIQLSRHNPTRHALVTRECWLHEQRVQNTNKAHKSTVCSSQFFVHSELCRHLAPFLSPPIINYNFNNTATAGFLQNKGSLSNGLVM